MRSSMFAVSSDSRVLLSCAHFDNEFRVSSLDSGRNLQCINEHRYTVSSLALDGQDTELLATASRDSTGPSYHQHTIICHYHAEDTNVIRLEFNCFKHSILRSRLRFSVCLGT